MEISRRKFLIGGGTGLVALGCSTTGRLVAALRPTPTLEPTPNPQEVYDRLGLDQRLQLLTAERMPEFLSSTDIQGEIATNVYLLYVAKYPNLPLTSELMLLDTDLFIEKVRSFANPPEDLNLRLIDSFLDRPSNPYLRQTMVVNLNKDFLVTRKEIRIERAKSYANLMASLTPERVKYFSFVDRNMTIDFQKAEQFAVTSGDRTLGWVVGFDGASMSILRNAPDAKAVPYSPVERVLASIEADRILTGAGLIIPSDKYERADVLAGREMLLYAVKKLNVNLEELLGARLESDPETLISIWTKTPFPRLQPERNFCGRWRSMARWP